MPMASALVVREPGESRVLSGPAGKARHLTGPSSRSPGSIDQNPVDLRSEVSAEPLAETALTPKDRVRHVETMSSNVPLLPAVAQSARVVPGLPASHSGQVDRATRARRSGPDRGHHPALVRGRVLRPDRDPLPEVRQKEARGAVRGHRRGAMANRANRGQGSRTGAGRAAADLVLEVRDALDAMNARRLRLLLSGAHKLRQIVLPDSGNGMSAVTASSV